MVQKCDNDRLPPGCPKGWPIRLTAASGIQIVYGKPHSRQPPGVERIRGIGIKMQNSEPNKREWMKHKDYWTPVFTEQAHHDNSWAGLYDQKLHELYYPFGLPNLQVNSMVLHLPMMGMPPREPTRGMMDEARSGRDWDQNGWFRYAYVIKAIDLKKARTNENTVIEDVVIKIGSILPVNSRRRGEDVIIELPPWPKSKGTNNAESLYSMTERKYGFEFRTALPECEELGETYDLADVKMENLYFIQLLQNELPSYHFWAKSRTDPRARISKAKPHITTRLVADKRGGPHRDSTWSSDRQNMRSKSRSSTSPPANAGGQQPAQPPSIGAATTVISSTAQDSQKSPKIRNIGRKSSSRRNSTKIAWSKRPPAKASRAGSGSGRGSAKPDGRKVVEKIQNSLIKVTKKTGSTK